MKRTIIALAALGTFSFAAIDTNAQSVNEETATVLVQDQSKEIEYEQLPDAVKKAFEESQYAEWEVQKVEEVTTEEGKEYNLTVSDGSQEDTLTFDEQGEMVE